MGIKELAKRVLSQKENLRYQFLLSKRKSNYGQWLEHQEAVWQEENDRMALAGACDSAYVFFCAAKGLMTSYARKSIVRYFIEHPEVQIVYGDEDVREGQRGGFGFGKRFFPSGENFCAPLFKPDWSPDVLEGCFYFGSLMAMRGEFFVRAAEVLGTAPLLRTVKVNDYLVTDFPGYVRWMRRCVELAGGYGKGSRGIGHVAQILFHCESRDEQLKFLEKIPCRDTAEGQAEADGTEASREEAATAETLQSELPRREANPEETLQSELSREEASQTESLQEELPRREAGRMDTDPVVSVIIPSKDHPHLLEKCLNSVKDTADGLGLEIIIVDNGSLAENREETEKLVGNVSGEGIDILYVYHPMEFNFSKMCNLGASKAAGRFLLFLNDDVELAVQGCIGRMAALAARPYTGAVGMKLYYPDSRRIQHAGITNLPMGPVHKLQFQEDGDAYGQFLGGNVNVLAVTGACLMAERRKFQEVGGFAEELRVAFNDVDLCFKLYESGYHNVCMNGCHAYHHESQSRGDDESVEKLERLLEEREKLYGAHPGLYGTDPYYSVHLCREFLDTKIRPAYETAGNRVQEYDRFLAGQTLYDCRRDQCVMVRVEAVRGCEISGWSAVLGDDNACYKMALVLKRVTEPFSPEADEWFRGPSGVCVVPLEGQYRPDLQENMPDQTNVALGGFHVRLKGNLLPPGKYRLGVAVRHRFTGAGLMNWSNRFLEV